MQKAHNISFMRALNAMGSLLSCYQALEMSENNETSTVFFENVRILLRLAPV